MGSGKSTIAKLLSKKLLIDAIDLDDYIAEKEKLSIPELFKKRGEVYFRKQENYYLKQLLNNDQNIILALGGGTPCYGNNMEEILKGGTSIYLQGKLPTIFNRLTNEKEQRPLISNLNNEQLMEFIAKHLFERSVFYKQANFMVDIDDKKKEDIVAEIEQLI